MNHELHPSSFTWLPHPSSFTLHPSSYHEPVSHSLCHHCTGGDALLYASCTLLQTGIPQLQSASLLPSSQLPSFPPSLFSSFPPSSAAEPLIYSRPFINLALVRDSGIFHDFRCHLSLLQLRQKEFCYCCEICPFMRCMLNNESIAEPQASHQLSPPTGSGAMTKLPFSCFLVFSEAIKQMLGHQGSPKIPAEGMERTAVAVGSSRNSISRNSSFTLVSTAPCFVPGSMIVTPASMRASRSD